VRGGATRLKLVFTRLVRSAMVGVVRLASDRFRCAQTGSTGLSSWAYGGSRNLVSHGRVWRSVPGR
jgi:hypothetical protein